MSSSFYEEDHNLHFMWICLRRFRISRVPCEMLKKLEERIVYVRLFMKYSANYS